MGLFALPFLRGKRERRKEEVEVEKADSYIAPEKKTEEK